MCYWVPKAKGTKTHIKELQGKTEFFFTKWMLVIPKFQITVYL